MLHSYFMSLEQPQSTRDGSFDAGAAEAAVARLLEFLSGLMPNITRHVAECRSDPARQRKLLNADLILPRFKW